MPAGSGSKTCRTGPGTLVWSPGVPRPDSWQWAGLVERISILPVCKAERVPLKWSLSLYFFSMFLSCLSSKMLKARCTGFHFPFISTTTL